MRALPACLRALTGNPKPTNSALISGPILKTPLARAQGTPSAVTSPCANTRLRVARNSSAVPSIQQPSGAGAR